MIELNDREFIARLSKLGIQLSHRDHKLIVSAPTGLVDENLKAELTRRKPALLALFERGAEGATNGVPPPDSERSLVPLSFAQQRLWLLDRIFPGNAAYNIPEAFVFQTAVDPEILKEAARRLMERHSILTAGIRNDGPKPKLDLYASPQQASIGQAGSWPR